MKPVKKNKHSDQRNWDRLISTQFNSLGRWKKFKPSMCQGCVALCCRLPVDLDLRDLQRLGWVPEDIEEVAVRWKKLAKDLSKRNLIKSFSMNLKKFQLAQKPNGDCIFLNQYRQCSVYNSRPEVCRLFPKIGPRPGHCPHATLECSRT